MAKTAAKAKANRKSRAKKDGKTWEKPSRRALLKHKAKVEPCAWPSWPSRPKPRPLPRPRPKPSPRAARSIADSVRSRAHKAPEDGPDWARFSRMAFRYAFPPSARRHLHRALSSLLHLRGACRPRRAADPFDLLRPVREPRREHEAWGSYGGLESQDPRRRWQRDQVHDLGIRRRPGVLLAADPDGNWRVGYRARGDWRVHSTGAGYTSGDPWLTQGQVSIDAALSLNPRWGLVGRAELIGSDSYGEIDLLPAGALAGSYRFDDKAELIFGAEYVPLSGNQYSEKLLLPLIEITACPSTASRSSPASRAAPSTRAQRTAPPLPALVLPARCRTAPPLLPES